MTGELANDEEADVPGRPGVGNRVRRLVLDKLPVASRGTSLLFNALLAVVIARLFGATASGEFFLALTAVNVAGMIGRLGTDMRAITVMPALFQRRSYGAIGRELAWLRKCCHRGSFVAGVTLATGGAALWLGEGRPVVGLGIDVAVLALSVPFSCSAILDSSVLRSSGRLSRGAFAETGLTQGLTIVLLGAASFVLALPSSSASFIYLLSAVCTATIARIWASHSIPRGPDLVAPSPYLREPGALKAMIHMMSSSVLFFVLTSSSLFALGLVSQPREIGLYNAATRISTVVALIPALQVTYLVPRVSRYLSGGDVEGANSALRRAARQATAVTVVAAVTIFVFANQIVGVFGSDFTDAKGTLYVLLVGQVVLAALGNINPLMSISGLGRTSVFIAWGVLAVGAGPLLASAAVGGSSYVALVYIAMSVAYAAISAITLKSRLGVKCYIS